MTNETKAMTWDEACGAAVGTVFIDRFDEGVRFVVLRGPGSCCAYLGIPKTHPLAGLKYDDLSVSCHGGLTYGSGGAPSEALGDDMYWYGWDYAHYQDASMHRFDEPRYDEHRWTPEEIDKDSWEAIYDFKKLMRLSEEAFAKGAGWRNGAQQ